MTRTAIVFEMPYGRILFLRGVRFFFTPLVLIFYRREQGARICETGLTNGF